MFAGGSNGSVELFSDHIVIKRKGLANVLTQGLQGDKSIPLTAITAVQLRPAGAVMGGLIQFTILGGREFRGGMLEATKDENAVIFDKKQEPAFLALRDAVQQTISRGAASSRGGTNSADELAKLVELVEKGYLTREEYDAQKRSILQQSSSNTVAPESRSTQSADSIRSRVNAMSDQAPVETPQPAKRKRHPLLIAALLILGVFFFLSYLGSSLKEDASGTAATSGAHWKQVGGLDDSEHFKFVEVNKANAGAAVYNDAISKLCGGGCVQVGFFVAGDSVPPSTSRSTFFQNGGWTNYSPAAVYFTDEFTKWDCEKAGSDGAPASALCGEGTREHYRAVLALATRVGWTKGCGLPETADKQLVERYAQTINDQAQRAQVLDTFKSMATSASNGPDDPADCENLRSRIEGNAKDARKALFAAGA